jgi:5-methylcytosine-specific restriction endonuclease McrA
MRRDDRRSPEAAAYRKLYKSARWQTLRRAQLTQHPLCRRCLHSTPRKLTPATVVHHIREHKGDEVLFFDPANLESSCKPHHDGEAQSEERVGYSTEVGVDGWPLDHRHPHNRSR